MAMRPEVREAGLNKKRAAVQEAYRNGDCALARRLQRQVVRQCARVNEAHGNVPARTITHMHNEVSR
jgi:hypothetical protein